MLYTQTLTDLETSQQVFDVLIRHLRKIKATNEILATNDQSKLLSTLLNSSEILKDVKLENNKNSIQETIKIINKALVQLDQTLITEIYKALKDTVNYDSKVSVFTRRKNYNIRYILKNLAQLQFLTLNYNIDRSNNQTSTSARLN